MRRIRVSARKIEAFLLAIGLMLLAIFLGFRIHSTTTSRAALRAFAASQAGSSTQRELPVVDTSLWSEERINVYRQSLNTQVDGPLAILAIPRLFLEVPVFNGTDETVLNRGLGRIPGTARPGSSQIPDDGPL